MNYKRVLLSAILGIIESTILFTILITINMYSIDYTNLNEPQKFSIAGINYLEVEKNGEDVEQNVKSTPIALTSTAFACLSYFGLSFVKNNKKRY